MRILIVEDDETLGGLISEYLGVLQHEQVQICSTGREASEVVANESYDCAFVDLMLPDANGLEILRTIKEYQPNTPIVLMSGHPSMEHAIQAIREGASDFLTKPFRLQDLALAVERLARERRLLLGNLALQQERQRLVNGFYVMFKSLVSALESRDPYLEKHSEKVTGYAVGMAESLHCSPAQIELLQTAGYLHDLGQFTVAESILNKPGPLSTEEYEVVKRHPVIGESMVDALGLSEEERAIIRHHHERWDGGGYPGGLAQGQIPFLARIVAVADAFDSMTSNRAYRGAMGESAAIQELLDNAGKQFDPEVVEVFVASRGDRPGDQERFDERRTEN